MKILILSDLFWESNLQKIKNEEVNNFKEKNLEKKKYEGIRRYFSLIKEKKPDLVLFAGDITGDGSCGHGFQNAMKIILQVLETNEIQSFFISGNHDAVDYYNELATFSDDLEFSRDISNQCIEFNGIKILGVSFDKSKNKKRFKELIAANNQKVDIVLSHAELKRRIWLFDLNADFVITGHFDKKLTSIENKIFISLDNDSSRETGYCLLNYKDAENVKIQYTIKRQRGEVKVVKGAVFSTSSTIPIFPRTEFIPKKGKFDIVTLKEEFKDLKFDKRNSYYINNGRRIKEFDEELKNILGFDFKQGIERIRKIKNEGLLLSDNEFNKLMKLRINSFYQVSKSMIVDYTGQNYKK